MIRVLIADDSITVRKTVAQQLSAAGIEVVGEATNGREAVALTYEMKPDVILMDVVMPGVDGLAATRRIMDEIPTPVVILSGYSDKEEIFKTCDALTAGALEVCAKPGIDKDNAQTSWNRILMIVKAASQVVVTRLHRQSTDSTEIPVRRPDFAEAPKQNAQTRAVVIGASTGGPAAVRSILSELPIDFGVPVFVALHSPGMMKSSIAEWLDRECAIQVRDAVQGEPLPAEPGTALTAPPGLNMKLTPNGVMLVPTELGRNCVPNIDELFSSAAEVYGDSVTGVLLTGMGSDGAQGLKRIRETGGRTIVQDKETSVVFGMPAAAIELGAAQQIASLRHIPLLLVQQASILTLNGSSGVKR